VQFTLFKKRNIAVEYNLCFALSVLNLDDVLISRIFTPPNKVVSINTKVVTLNIATHFDLTAHP
jgi:hypothetical protein